MATHLAAATDNIYVSMTDHYESSLEGRAYACIAESITEVPERKRARKLRASAFGHWTATVPDDWKPECDRRRASQWGGDIATEQIVMERSVAQRRDACFRWPCCLLPNETLVLPASVVRQDEPSANVAVGLMSNADPLWPMSSCGRVVFSYCDRYLDGGIRRRLSAKRGSSADIAYCPFFQATSAMHISGTFPPCTSDIT